MKTFHIKAITASVLFLLCSCLTMTAQFILPFGQFSKEPWPAKYYFAKNTEEGPAKNWFAVDFDESTWGDIEGPISSISSKYYATKWNTLNSTYWVRRHFTIDEIKGDYALFAIHDDECEIYLNGYKIYDESRVISSPNVMSLTEEMKQHLVVGDNIMAAKVHDDGVEAYMDFGLYESYVEDLLVEGSVPVTFENDATYPWYVMDGVATNGNSGNRNSTSTLTTNYSSDKYTVVSWTEVMSNTYNSDYHKVYIYIDGELRKTHEAGTLDCDFFLSPGSHTIMIRDSIGDTSSNYTTRVSNLNVYDKGNVDVSVKEAGNVRTQVLYQVEQLDEVIYLKIKGPMGDKDWDDITRFTNLRYIDLTEVTTASAIPDNAFVNSPKLEIALLPEGITSIGANAFNSTMLSGIDIPSSVTLIGNEAFRESKVEYVNFKEDSKLEMIGYRAFYGCKQLKEFIMPNSVKKLGYDGYYRIYTFSQCTALKTLKFSDNITEIHEETCSGCSALQNLILPKNLIKIDACAFKSCSSLDSLIIPKSVNDLGSGALECCTSLKYIELPAMIFSYRYSYDYSPFYGCNNIQTVVCKTAPPPTVSNNDLFPSTDNNKITLYVPDFALADYKYHPAWYTCSPILPYDTSDWESWRIAGELSMSEGKRMHGKPDMEVYYDGKLKVSGNDPMKVKNLDFYINESNPGVLLNDCGQFTADSITTRFSVSKNTWYFITPMHDVKLSDVKHTDESASFVFRYYNAAYRAENGGAGKGSWQNVTDDILRAGQGYIYQCNRDGELIMPAAKETQANVFNMAETTTTLNAYAAENTVNANWNFVGNTFPCYFDMYYLDYTAPITIREGNGYKAYSLTDDDVVLRPMQPFFVQKPNDIDKMVFRHEGRQLTTTVSRPTSAPKKNVSKNRFLFNLEISDGEQTDQTRIVFNNAAKMDYELERDASKFMSDEPTMPQIYSIDMQGNHLAINERPEQDGKVSLGVHIGQYGFYTICATRADADIILYDAQTGETIDLTKNSYTFTSNAADYNDRFFLNTSGTTGISSADTEAHGSWLKDYGLFNLNGQKVSNSYKGIVIKNGHKVIK